MGWDNLKKRAVSVLTKFSIIVAIVLLVFQFSLLGVHAQPEIVFTTVDKFEIPSKNSSIRFAANGTYRSATLDNDVWIFENLYFPNPINTEKLNLTVSAQDCDIIISPYSIFNRISRGENVKWVILRYTVAGQGMQVVNLGLDPDKGQLDAILDGEFVGLNHGWTRDYDGTITVTRVAANVTLWYYGYPDSYTQNVDFFEQHSVMLSSTFSFAVIVVLTTIIAQKRKGSNDS